MRKPQFGSIPARDCSNGIVTRRRKQYLDSLTSRVEPVSRVKIFAFFRWADSVARTIQSGFLGEQGRGKRIALARDGSAACRATRRSIRCWRSSMFLLDDARCHHARHVQDWLAQPGCRITLLMRLPNDRPALLAAHERSASNALDARRAVER
jgi:hypothetical protein